MRNVISFSTGPFHTTNNLGECRLSGRAPGETLGIDLDLAPQ
jgi:hypothetical protein